MDNTKLTEQSKHTLQSKPGIELIVDRNILIHPHSRKKEIIQLQTELRTHLKALSELEAKVAE